MQWIETQNGALLNLANIVMIGTPMTNPCSVVAYDNSGGDRDEVTIGQFDSTDAADAFVAKLADLLIAVSVAEIASAAGPAASVRTG